MHSVTTPLKHVIIGVWTWCNNRLCTAIFVGGMCVWVCVCVYGRVCVWACVCVCAPACVHACVYVEGVGGEVGLKWV